MKKFFIILAVSAVFIAGIWIIPAINNYDSTKKYSKLEQYSEPESYNIMEEALKDTIAMSDSRTFDDSTVLSYQPRYNELQEQIVTASAAQSFDW